MTSFSLGEIKNSSVWGIFRMREQIDMNPVYQRESDIWTADKRELLIDTIVNGFDVPKIYMHKFPESTDSSGKKFEFAVIDGKQRLSAMWAFIQGSFALSDDFTYIKDETFKLAGLTYSDIGTKYPDIKADFDAYKLDVVTIETPDIELIEDMFSRLNEAMPLNAAEKRNARPGPLPASVRLLVAEKFFASKLPFTNRRYRHFDLAAKMLLLASRDNVVDTKKAYIDRFFEQNSHSTPEIIKPFQDKVIKSLNAMSTVFIDKDPLLRSAGMVSLYYILFEKAVEKSLIEKLTRPTFLAFNAEREKNREAAESDIASADYKLLEFDRYTQSPNDGIALRFRLAVIDEKIFEGAFGFEVPE